ncbi:MAG: RNA polymerase sigma factor [Lentimicrobium sp.]|uniref:RNA polymerase sigma factor n=1 Tax=Lentimicrobium sp. TaxID=2034841 RepID=UPI0025FCB714|nr:RNA polymerase sigma factor [Lentimicrobium sp.]MCO5258101.1 RNA polymerase sigma factor [Lentimicrobium sp.]MCO5263345.1 RNA polymerase sigma factor [Lentimicrobium sp.]HPF64655.1 RNA polymerase sigma factor [Lentimicrobium sp.]HPJ62875.1 RNA polymerase sigma factor [Lentimicrobium sp.]HRW69208.1 RNA polymerase sigma factor [Lentimicrobium sp.]
MDQVEQLVEECKSGNRQAQMEIYRQYYKPMYNTCLRMVSVSADAEDIMQNSFIDAFRSIKSYRGKSPFYYWLRRIVINNAMDHLKNRNPDMFLTDTLPEIPETGDDAEDGSVELQVNAVKNAMDQLHDDYRVILSLYLFEGMDQEEIGDILKLNPGNVRTRLSRARQALISRLSDYSRRTPAGRNK